LYVIEYANLNSQAAFNAELTSDGYKQGGLGDGVTTWDGDWSTFNGYNPFIPCGTTDSLGNGTGIVAYTVSNTDAGGSITKTFNVPRYRGIENPFGHIWKWTDGCNFQINPSTDNGGDGLSKCFVCSDPSKFNDTNYNGYRLAGNEARSNGYIKEILFGAYGDILAKTVGGGSTTYFADYHYCSVDVTSSVLRGLLLGGLAYHGAAAGLVYSLSSYVPSSSYPTVGSRLCFIPD
jgi:hypothetical protein